MRRINKMRTFSVIYCQEDAVTLSIPRGFAIFTLFLAFCCAPVALAQKTVFAPPVVADLGAGNVRLEVYGWEEADRKFTPSAGLFAADGSMHDQIINGRYQMAL